MWLYKYYKAAPREWHRYGGKEMGSKSQVTSGLSFPLFLNCCVTVSESLGLSKLRVSSKQGYIPNFLFILNGPSSRGAPKLVKVTIQMVRYAEWQSLKQNNHLQIHTC